MFPILYMEKDRLKSTNSFYNLLIWDEKKKKKTTKMNTQKYFSQNMQ